MNCLAHGMARGPLGCERPLFACGSEADWQFCLGFVLEELPAPLQKYPAARKLGRRIRLEAAGLIEPLDPCLKWSERCQLSLWVVGLWSPEHFGCRTCEIAGRPPLRAIIRSAV